MKYAGKLNARYTVIIGENELNNNTLAVKNMLTGEQVAIDREKLTEFIGGK